jgi:ribosomal protein S18 acetylase RimI-like enzyme
MPHSEDLHGDSIILRKAEPQDDAFLFQVYASTRAEELAVVDWSAEQKEAFLRMQFDAQRSHYLTHYPQAEYSLICRGDEPIGRLIMDRPPEMIHVIDLALLPGARGQGIGTRLLRELQTEAAAKGLPLRLYVEIFNPAQRLYQRLGFVQTAEQGVYLELEWRAPAAQKDIP